MMKILIEGWICYPHSYALVNVYQIVSLMKTNLVKIYFHKQPGYKDEWPVFTDLTDLMLTREEQNLLDSMERWDPSENIKVDLIYRICYPLDQSLTDIPTIVFYTAEFQKMYDHFFVRGTVSDFVSKCENGKLIPITPSRWSANALLRKKIESIIIPHGIDNTKFFVHKSDVNLETRKKYNIPEDAFVFLNVSAMTGNKNITGIIKAFYHLSFLKDNVYLILKGIGNLYACEQNINQVIKQLIITSVISKNHWKSISHRLIYLDDFYGYEDFCKLYNIADCYISPYIAEGFNIPVLEALACGIPLIVSKGGSTDDFLVDINITENEFAKFPKTLLGHTATLEHVLVVDDISIQETMINMINDTKFRENVKIKGPLQAQKFTWDLIAIKLYNCFNNILDAQIMQNMTHSFGYSLNRP